MIYLVLLCFSMVFNSVLIVLYVEARSKLALKNETNDFLLDLLEKDQARQKEPVILKDLEETKRLNEEVKKMHQKVKDVNRKLGHE